MNTFSQFRKKMVLFTAIIVLYLFQTAELAHGAFTIDDEKKLGKEFFEKLEQSGALIQDPKVNSYIDRLGNRILSNSQKAPFNFRFSIIKSSAINAFATPGGYVYVNRGLINLVESESQLAGVLAHEIAHVNARHIADIIDKSKKVSIGTLAAILAGAFLGGGGDVAAAVTSFAMATATALNLNYSREHEEEADRLGISYLVSAGYEGKAMLDFLKIMRRYEFYSNSVPSYFLTHPGTDERIGYLDGLLQTIYTRPGAENIIGQFKRIQIILILNDDRNLDTKLKHFQNELEKNPHSVDDLYGLAVIQEKLGLIPESLKNFHQALKLSPNDKDILRDTGIAYFKTGRSAEAINFLNKALSINEDDVNTLVYLGRSYEAQGDYATALTLYRKLEKKNIDDEEAYYNIAMAYGKTNNPGDSHYNFGIYFKKKNKRESALFHFKEALKYFPKDSQRAKDIKKEMEAMKTVPLGRKAGSGRSVKDIKREIKTLPY
ncbi:MAG: hypothetical protein CO012_07525 [Syntrophobacterales bacterium CG_4_8_14_3_um_filter_49_14]|nr:MAG: hypothetical protein COX52_06300 [Syntrophobacterales bacterium CG23_combo_of_CG06-09_8_20_14_all_48_27]PJA48078.1 MAG: hypothetical protein CO171_08275 [Syntrophobacterales bacterium CG_4_9_14_3_um_filter_49_8]PJC74000.1 MAG: hypothetical protein CO012_07525 [Syntrophobacterales bacterium CG_4_8_14_3_um_filter_49_14]